MELKHKITHVVPPSPKTFRGQPSYLEAGPQYLLYFNGPSVILRPYDNQPSLSITHTCQITAVKYAYGYKQIASIDEKGNLLIHAISGSGSDRTLRLIYNYQGIYLGARCMDWTSDNKRLCIVGTSKNRFGRVIAVETGVDVGQITGVSANLSTVSIRPQRPFKLATGGEQFTIKFYDGPPYKFNSSKVSHKSYINQIKYSPDGKRFVSVGSDRKILTYDGATCQILKQMEEGHSGGIMGIVWLDNDTFVTGGSDKKLKKWSSNLQLLAESDSNQNKEQLSLIDSFVVSVSYCAEKQSIFYTLLSGQIKQIDKNLSKIQNSYQGYRGKITKIISLPQQRNSAILVDEAGKILKLTINKDKYTIQRYLRHLLCYNKVFYDACISTNITYALAGESQIHLFDINNVEELKISNMTLEGAKFVSPIYSKNVNAFLVFGENNIKIYQKNNENHQKVGEHKLLGVPTSNKVAINNRHQSNLIFVGNQKGIVQVFNLEINQQKSIKISKLGQWQTNTNKITFIQNHEDLLFTGDSAGNIKVHQIKRENQNLQLFKITDSMGGCHTTIISSILIINSNIYTLSFDNKLIIWNLSDYSRIKTFLDVHRHGILNGNIVAGTVCSSGGDLLIKLHEV